MSKNDDLSVCEHCGAKERRSGDSLHCWDIEYECGGSIVGGIGFPGHDEYKPCPNKNNPK